MLGQRTRPPLIPHSLSRLPPWTPETPRLPPHSSSTHASLASRGGTMVVPVCSWRTVDLYRPFPSTSYREQSQAAAFLVASKHHPRTEINPSTPKPTSFINWVANLDPNHVQRGLNSGARFHVKQGILAKVWSQLLGVHLGLIGSRIEVF